MRDSASIPLKDRILGGLWGSIVGDALGVLVEFKDRVAVQLDPVTDMREYGTHNQPRGTWSDDGAFLNSGLNGVALMALRCGRTDSNNSMRTNL